MNPSARYCLQPLLISFLALGYPVRYADLLFFSVFINASTMHSVNPPTLAAHVEITAFLFCVVSRNQHFVTPCATRLLHFLTLRVVPIPIASSIATVAASHNKRLHRSNGRRLFCCHFFLRCSMNRNVRPDNGVPYANRLFPQ
jgi:hypothetical protein